VMVWSEDQPGVVVGRHAQAVDHFIEMVASGSRSSLGVVAAGPRQRMELQPDQPDELHLDRVRRVIEYLRAGDVYQVNITRRWTATRGQTDREADAIDILTALQAVAPSPFGAVFEFTVQSHPRAIISASPELFLSRRGSHIETRPIKGTRRRTGHDDQDLALAAELAYADKDGAEHLMIVDLERNDFGRVCEVGSVHVPQLGYILTLPQLLHKVSRVVGRLAADASVADVLRATFPGGSITGAPKVRAMQIISELEPVRRGPYCGALGWFGSDSFDLAMAIRVGLLSPDALTVHVGGGIVLDSNPQQELAETYDKIAGWQAALRLLNSSPTTG
jgi:para-aminobenzoate synthetase component I